MTDPTATANPPRWRLEPFDVEDEAPAHIPLRDPDRYGEAELCSGSDTLGITADDLPPLDVEVDTDG